MWKCVMCETNNPVHCEECFICGTKKSDSLRISEDIKKREAYEKEMAEKAAAEKKTVDEPDEITSGIFGTASHKPAYEGTKTPDIDPVPGYPSSVSDAAGEISEDVWADELAERVEKSKKKAELERKTKTIGEKIFCGILLAVLIFLFVGGILYFFVFDSKASAASYSTLEMAYSESYDNIDNCCENNAENTISKDALKCFV